MEWFQSAPKEGIRTSLPCSAGPTAQTIKANCGGRNKVGGGIKGKKKVTVFQNSKTHASSYPHRDQCDLYSEKEKENIGVEFISNIRGKSKLIR